LAALPRRHRTSLWASGSLSPSELRAEKPDDVLFAGSGGRQPAPYCQVELVLDNADEPEDLYNVIPQGGAHGHVLLTSRNHRWESIAQTVSVDVFPEAESVEFLKKRIPRGITRKEAEELAEALGHLPLALEQAGALRAETGMSNGEYLRLLAEQPASLLREGKPTEYPAPMTAAWQLSVSKLQENLPEAMELLRRFGKAFNAGDVEAIDTEVIQQGQLVFCVDVPTVCGADWGDGLAGIALVHRHHAIVRREVLNGVPRRIFPKRHRRAHPSWRDEQDRESLAMLFIVQLDIVPFEYWHVCSLLP
jgi:hypothetical protein